MMDTREYWVANKMDDIFSPQQLILLSLLKDVQKDSERGTTLGRVKAEVSSSYGRGRKQEFLVESLQDSL